MRMWDVKYEQKYKQVHNMNLLIFMSVPETNSFGFKKWAAVCEELFQLK